MRRPLIAAIVLTASVALVGCGQDSSFLGQLGSPSSTGNLTVTGTVETDDGSYQTVRPSDDYMNGYESPFFDMNNEIPNIDPAGGALVMDAQSMYSWVRNFYFTQWIDSTALEGDAATREAWLADMLSSGRVSSSDFTKTWLADPEGSAKWLPLRDDTIVSGAVLDFVHDGEPRMSDASIELSNLTWQDSADSGPLVLMTTDWTVDYRLTDQAVIDAISLSNDVPAGEVRDTLLDEVTDGEGVNSFAVTGTNDWLVRVAPSEGEFQLVSIGTQLHYSFQDFVKKP